MARGFQKDGYDVTAMEMTKWFDTNYHYIVPEFKKNQSFRLNSTKVIAEYKEALSLGIRTKPVLISPFTYLYLGKEKEEGFHRLELLDSLLPVFYELLEQLYSAGAEYIQLDEPCLALNLKDKERNKLSDLYNSIALKFPQLKIILTKKVMHELERVCAPGGEVIIVNHFAQDHGVRGRVEKWMSPFARLLGWHPDFVIETISGITELELIEVRAMHPMGLFTMLRFKKPDAKPV